MKIFASLVIGVLVVLASTSSFAESGAADSEKAGRQLRKYAADLREIAAAMQKHAETPVPAALGDARKRIFSDKRRELLATANATLKLASRVGESEKNASRGALTREDMNRLTGEVDALAARVDQEKARAIAPKQMNAADLNEAISEVESMQETVRNKRQQAVTAFQNFDQKWNQLFNMLTTVLKNKKDMEAGTTRNML